MTTAIALVVTVTSARRRLTPSGRYYTLMTLAVTLWAGFGILEVSATTVDLKVFWPKFEYVGAAAVPVLLFLFVTSQELRGRAHSKGTIAALSRAMHAIRDDSEARGVSTAYSYRLSGHV